MTHPLDTIVTEPNDPKVSPRSLDTINKGLIISLDGPRPEFTFLGEWNGHNIMSVYNHLKRAYHLYNRSLRRGMTLKDLTLNEPSNSEGEVK